MLANLSRSMEKSLNTCIKAVDAAVISRPLVDNSHITSNIYYT